MIKRCVPRRGKTKVAMMLGALAFGATIQLLWGVSVGGSPPNMKGRVYPGISNGLPGAKLEHRCGPHPLVAAWLSFSLYV